AAGGRASSRVVRAVDGVDLSVSRGETVGLVGESGCGKTTVGNSIIGLVEPVSGRIRFEGNDTAGLSGSRLKGFRRDVQMIFQDPYGALNPRIQVGAGISEVLRAHGLSGGRRERTDRVSQLLRNVGLDPSHAARYPHEFSGGQRQRIGIARALAVAPSLVIADEPVSALDVSVQVQILNLMRDLQEQMELSYLFVAHDLAVVSYMCDRVLVMYLGKIVEEAGAQDLFANPSHPYTEALLSAVPDVDEALRRRPGLSRRIVLQGDVPSPAEIIPGCAFHPRCHRARRVCGEEAPPRKDVGNGHASLCHFAAEMTEGRDIPGEPLIASGGGPTGTDPGAPGSPSPTPS
ncbi:MAG: ABC transporter ATP-binding protein, partial [Lentisphaerae bacterium]|nr:ABC transporter ATP-binding protein [Lentisphaerota bacterium]